MNELTKQATTTSLDFVEFNTFASSLEMADHFDLEHSVILEAIEQADIPVNFKFENFSQWRPSDSDADYIHREYLLTQDGFIMVGMLLSGEEASNFRVRLVKTFRKMAERLVRVPNDGNLYNVAALLR